RAAHLRQVDRLRPGDGRELGALGADLPGRLDHQVHSGQVQPSPMTAPEGGGRERGKSGRETEAPPVTVSNMSILLSVNLGAARPTEHSDIGYTGIDKRPVNGPVQVRAPGRKGIGGSGLVGDRVCDLRHHGGDHQAVYAYAREDLVRWSAELDRAMPPGSFGENLTTVGVNVTGALIGERWRIGRQVVLEVC